VGYLYDLADVCRRTGFPVIECDGWATRGRSGSGGDQTGGYTAGLPNHVIVHHTASGPASDGWPDVNYCLSHPDAPVGNLYLSRVPEVYVMAGGAANTNGSGSDPCGVTADDSMNSASIAIEAGNGGTGEAWPAAMLDCYLLLVDALCDGYGIATSRVHAHAEWAPSRKIDPAGPPRYAQGGATWDMDAFRADLDGPTTPLPPGGDDMTDDQARQLAELFNAIVPMQAGFAAPGSADGLSPPWAALWGYQVIQSDVVPLLLSLADRLTAIEAKLG
jgi:hypothetical protein